MKKTKKLTVADLANGYSKATEGTRESIDQGNDIFSSRGAKLLKCKRLLHNI